VSELLPDVRHREELHGVDDGERRRERRRRVRQRGHRRRGAEERREMAAAKKNEREREDVRADDAADDLERDLRSLQRQDQSGEDARGGRDHVQRDVQGVVVVRAEARGEVRERLERRHRREIVRRSFRSRSVAVAAAAVTSEDVFACLLLPSSFRGRSIDRSDRGRRARGRAVDRRDATR